MKKKLMILGGGPFQLPAIVKAKEMGLDVIVCDYYPDCVGKQVEGVIGELISTYDYEGVLAAAKKHKIDAIMTLCTDYPMRIVAYVAKQLGLPCISEEAAYMATDKGAMRQCLKENGVPVPQFELVKSKEEYLTKLADFDCPVVIKAVDNSGSRGIQMLDDPRDLKMAEEAYDYCVQYSRSGDILIEEYMDGPEVCLGTLNYQGECYTVQLADQLRKLPPYFTDSGYSQPSLLDEETQKKICEITVAANKALKNDNGSSCTEIIVTKSGPKIVEIGPRLPGDYLASHLSQYANGIDLIEGVIKIAFGEAPDLEPKFDKASCIRYYMTPVEGEIAEIAGVDAAKAVPGIKDVILVKQPGDTAVPLRSSNDRIGLVISQKDTVEEAIASCEEALSKIQIVLK